MKNITVLLVLIFTFFGNSFSMQGGNQKQLDWGGLKPNLDFNGTLVVTLKPAALKPAETIQWGGNLKPAVVGVPKMPAAQTQEIDAINERLKTKNQETNALLTTIENEELDDSEKKAKLEQAQKLMAEQEKLKKEYVAKAQAAINNIKP